MRLPLDPHYGNGVVAKVVPKVKYFVWRVIWMILPTTDNLGRLGESMLTSVAVFVGNKLNLSSIFFLLVRLAKGYGI